MGLSTITLPLLWIYLNGIEFYSFYILYIISAGRGVDIVTDVNAVLPYMPVFFLGTNFFFWPRGRHRDLRECGIALHASFFLGTNFFFLLASHSDIGE